jgi:cation diffusion facilitator CzcD-associated flavoprotein CzcO
MTASNMAKSYLQREIKDETVRKQLTPDYEIGCKRIIPSSYLYPTFNLSHVKLISNGILKTVGNSIYTEDGSNENVDV